MTTTYVPLRLLCASDSNVRKQRRPEMIARMAASIKLHGLLMPLLVRTNPEAMPEGWEVVAGETRRLAMVELLNEGHLSPDYLVRTIEIPDNADASVISLIENEHRTSMHVVDVAAAIAKIHDQRGPDSKKNLAAEIGASEVQIGRALQLMTLAPEIFDMFAEDGIDFEMAQAFSICPDHDKQLFVLAKLKDASVWQQSAAFVRRLLTEDHLRETHPRVAFIGGVEAYEARGGKVNRDLFSENVFLTDHMLISEMEHEKLLAAALELVDQGWLVLVEPSDDEMTKFTFLSTLPEFPVAHQAMLDKLEAEANALDAEYEAAESEQEQDLLRRKITATVNRLEEMSHVAHRKWTKKQKADLLLVVRRAHDQIDIRGPYKSRTAKSDDAPAPAGDDPDTSSVWSNAAVERLLHIQWLSVRNWITETAEAWVPAVMFARYAHGIDGFTLEYQARKVTAAASEQHGDVSQDQVDDTTPWLAPDYTDMSADAYDRELGVNYMLAASVAQLLSPCACKPKALKALGIYNLGFSLRSHWTPTLAWLSTLTKKQLAEVHEQVGIEMPKAGKTIDVAESLSMAFEVGNTEALRTWVPEPLRP